MRKWTICVCLGLAMCLVTLRAQVQETEPTEREKALLNRLEELEKRVSQLEAELRKTQAAPKVPSELDTRMQGVEEEVENVAVIEEELKKIAAAEEKPDTFRVFWKEGLNLETADSAFKMKIGGRIHFDNAWTSGHGELVEDLGSLKDGVEFRRATLGVSGSIYDKVEFRTEYDFAGGSFKYKDDKDSVSTFSGGEAKWQEVYVGVLDVPVVGNIRIGHVYETEDLVNWRLLKIVLADGSISVTVDVDTAASFKLFYRIEVRP